MLSFETISFPSNDDTTSEQTQSLFPEESPLMPTRMALSSSRQLNFGNVLSGTTQTTFGNLFLTPSRRPQSEFAPSNIFAPTPIEDQEPPSPIAIEKYEPTPLRVPMKFSDLFGGNNNGSSSSNAPKDIFFMSRNSESSEDFFPAETAAGPAAKESCQVNVCENPLMPMRGGLNLFLKKSENSFNERLATLQATKLFDSSSVVEAVFPSDEFSPSSSRNARRTGATTISCSTLTKLVDEETMQANEDSQLLIIDTRFEYEFRGGHIKNAINIPSLELLDKAIVANYHLLANPQYVSDLKSDVSTAIVKADAGVYSVNFQENYLNEETNEFDNKRQKRSDGQVPKIVFHCEFSKKRGPRAFRMLQNKIRSRNLKNSSDIQSADIYLLENGYEAFFQQYPEYCYGGYVTMTQYRDEYARVRSLEQQRQSIKNGFDGSQ